MDFYNDMMNYFADISEIPRGSHNTKAISDFLVNFAQKHGFKYRQDMDNNVIVWKSAQYCKNQDVIALQAHTDMVCVKTETSQHDFLTDSIEYAEKDDYLMADETTLGSDNGIGVAMMLMILDSKEISHPDIEAIFTADEEVGMIGAKAIDLSDLRSEKLINLDFETEGYLIVSCAGAATIEYKNRLDYQNIRGNLLRLEISGLSGGHSGLEIDKQHGNSIKILARLLSEIEKIVPFRINKLDGGSAVNCIPSNAMCNIVIDIADKEKFSENFARLKIEIEDEFYPDEQGLEIKLIIGDYNEYQVYTKDLSNTLIYILNCVPDGVLCLSRKIPGLVETSINLGILKENKDNISVFLQGRSLINSKQKELLKKLHYLVQYIDAEMIVSEEYPAWDFAKESKFRDYCAEKYRVCYNGKKPIITGVHAGLECSILCEKKEKLDCVSIGPNIYNAHTFKEKAEVESIKRVWKYLLALLKG